MQIMVYIPHVEWSSQVFNQLRRQMHMLPFALLDTLQRRQARGRVSTVVDNLALTSDPDMEAPICRIDKGWAEGAFAGLADHDILVGVLAAIELVAIVGFREQRSSRPAASTSG